jgi:Transposase DDE domain
MTSIALERDEDWLALASHLPRNYEQLAKEHKQLQVQYGNAKLTTADWLLRFILLHVGGNLPLRQTVALMAEAGGPELSPMRLHMKMRRATPYLHALIERMVTWTTEGKPELWDGYSLTLVDATTMSGPGAIGTDARLHTKLRVADVAVLDAVVTDAHGAEGFKHFAFRQGELVLGDRIYCTLTNIAMALEHGADVLLRYKRTLPLFRDDEKVEVLAELRELAEGSVADLDVVVEGEDGPIRGRFIASRLPADEAAHARRRLKRKLSKKGEKLTPEALEAANFITLFTTVPRARMSGQRCLDAYRLRWQIELQFKRWKSLCGFDRLPNYRDDTIIAWVHAKLLLGILLDRMCSIRGELSPPVQLASYEPPTRKRRRTRAEMDAAAAMEADKHPVPARRRRAATAQAS